MRDVWARLCGAAGCGVWAGRDRRINPSQVGNHTITSECGTKPKFQQGPHITRRAFKSHATAASTRARSPAFFGPLSPSLARVCGADQRQDPCGNFLLFCGARERASERRAIPPLRELPDLPRSERFACVERFSAPRRAAALSIAPEKVKGPLRTKECRDSLSTHCAPPDSSR